MSEKKEESEVDENKVCCSDVSIHPSYTRLLKLPYDVICRRRLVQKKRRFAAQMDHEINHMIAMKMRAVDGIRLDLLFSFNE